MQDQLQNLKKLAKQEQQKREREKIGIVNQKAKAMFLNEVKMMESESLQHMIHRDFMSMTLMRRRFDDMRKELLRFDEVNLKIEEEKQRMDKRIVISQRDQAMIHDQKVKNEMDFENKKKKIEGVARDMLYFAAIYSKEKEEI